MMGRDAIFPVPPHEKGSVLADLLVSLCFPLSFVVYAYHSVQEVWMRTFRVLWGLVGFTVMARTFESFAGFTVMMRTFESGVGFTEMVRTFESGVKTFQCW
jgi:hypothetical protein